MLGDADGHLTVVRAEVVDHDEQLATEGVGLISGLVERTRKVLAGALKDAHQVERRSFVHAKHHGAVLVGGLGDVQDQRGSCEIGWDHCICELPRPEEEPGFRLQVENLLRHRTVVAGIGVAAAAGSSDGIASAAAAAVVGTLSRHAGVDCEIELNIHLRILHGREHKDSNGPE